ncbi:MAG TPA: nitroreductase family protein [Caulobacteraceae bacterium]
MDAIEAIHGRRSIRAYEAKPVERSLIEAVVWDAVQAPSTPVSGRQPWIFNIVEGAERIGAYGDRAKAYARDNRPKGPGYGWADQPEFSVFFDAPVVVVISGAVGNSQALAECCRAGQNLMISAYARGLGTCWVGSPMLWMRDLSVRAELGIPDGFEPFVVFTLGWPRIVPEGQAREAPIILWSEG